MIKLKASLTHLYDSMDVLAGSISVERLESLLAYREKTRLWWVCFMIFMTPLPPMIMILILYYIPLKDPSLGWKENSLMFLQAFVVVCITHNGLRSQRVFYIPGGKTSLIQNIILTIVAASFYTLFLFLFNSQIVFPMPFGLLAPLILVVPVVLLIVTISLKHNAKRNTVGTTNGATVGIYPDPATSNGASRSGTNTQQLLAKYKRIVKFNFSLLFIYPLFATGFKKLSGKSQTMYTLLLPVMKWTLMHVSKRRYAHVEDLAAESVIFSVELFNALFVSMCMSFNSIETSVLLIILDVAHIFWAFKDFSNRASKLIQVHEEYMTTSHSKGLRLSSKHVIRSALEFANSHRNQLAGVQGIQWDSPAGIEYRRSIASNGILSLGSSQTNSTTTATTTTIQMKLYPQDSKVPASELTPAQKQQVEILRQALALSFAMEHIILTEYVEAFVPYFYALYTICAFHSPNVPYVDGFDVMTEDKMSKAVRNILIYGSLELASLFILYYLVKRRFNMNIFWHLSFVLENHFQNIQGKLLFFLPFLLSFPIRHYGMDFTGEFKWLRKTTIPQAT